MQLNSIKQNNALTRLDYASAGLSRFQGMETNLQLATARQILLYSSIC